MKNKIVLIVLASTLLFFARAGMTELDNENYIGIQYGIGQYSEDGISQEFNPTVLIGRIGHYFHPSISVEARMGSGLEDDTQFLPEFGASGLDVALELDSMFGVYGVGHLNLTGSFSVYGVLGVSKVKGTASVPSSPGLKSSEDNSSVSYGVGANFDIGSNLGLNVEYMRYLDKSEFDLDVIGLGVEFSF